MAIRLEFINLIVPIEKINQYYPGGFKAFSDENWSMFGGKLWHDDYLFRDGAMSPQDMQSLVDYWKELGLTPFEEQDGQTHWKDMCVVDFCRGLTLPCNWLEHDRSDQSVCLKSKPKGQVIGREEMKLLRNTRKRNTDKLDKLFSTKKINLDRGTLFNLVAVPKSSTFDFRRVEGMLLGIAIGDALGITTESKLVPLENVCGVYIVKHALTRV